MTERTIQHTYRVEELTQEIEKKNKCEMALKEGGVARWWQVFEEEENEWKTQKVNLAIAGGSVNEQEEMTERTIQQTYRVEELKQEIEKKKNKFEMALKEGGIARCWQVFEEEINEWKPQKVNLAIAGQTGTGKSSFINAIFKKWTGERSARVGVTETTMKCVGYEHPNNPNIVLWDLPGVGTDNFPQASYLAKVNADLFDVFIILTADRFTEQDAWLGKEMQKRKKPVIFVRKKIGTDFENSKHDYPENDEKTVLEQVKADMMAQSVKFLQALGFFQIDSHKSDMYEFRDLEKCILDKLPDSKGKALVFSISRMSRDVVELKVAQLKKQVWSAGMTSFALGIVRMLPAITEEAVVRHHASFYVEQLGLDVKSLERRSINPKKLNDVKIKVEEVMADLPYVVKLPISVRIFQLLPLVGGGFSADVVAHSLKEILERLEVVAVEAIEAFNECE